MYSKLRVLRSNAGFYLGRIFSEYGLEYPGTRESDYFKTKEEVVQAVRNGIILRHCSENLFAYNEGLISTMPGSLYQNPNFEER